LSSNERTRVTRVTWNEHTFTFISLQLEPNMPIVTLTHAAFTLYLLDIAQMALSIVPPTRPLLASARHRQQRHNSQRLPPHGRHNMRRSRCGRPLTEAAGHGSRGSADGRCRCEGRGRARRDGHYPNLQQQRQRQRRQRQQQQQQRWWWWRRKHEFN
jgi:hypothetical protein